MFDRLTAALSALWNFATTDGATPATGTVKYDLVIKYVDEDRDETTRTFATDEARQVAVARYLPAGVSADDEDAIASLVFEDRLVFWRRSKATPELPKTAPLFPGQGDLVLQLRTSRNGQIEVEGCSMRRVMRILDTCHDRLAMVPREASVIRRRTAYERREVLVKSAL